MRTGNENSPGTTNADGSLTVANVALAGSGRVVDLTVCDGRLRAIHPTAKAAEWVCLPPLADLHVHANRAFTPSAVRPEGLTDAARNVREIFASFSRDDYQRHAEMLLRTAYGHATTRLRTHADVDASVQMGAVLGSLGAAEQWAGKLDVGVVAFASSSGDPATSEGRKLLREAVSLGAQFLGAAPAFCTDQAATIDAVLDLAVELAVPVDLHLDEHLDDDRSFSEYLASATIERGLEGRVTLGHACAVAALAPADRVRVIERLAAAQITVIALPRTNLYLQDRGGHTPALRGVTCVKELIAAGVQVRFASDNVQDAFYPYGDADLLGAAMDGILATHLDDARALVSAICDGRSDVRVGDVADFVLLPGPNLDAVLASPPAERWLVAGGAVARAGE